VCLYLYNNFVTVFNIAVSNSDYIASNNEIKVNIKISTEKKLFVT
jgi:hypothetical protein